MLSAAHVLEVKADSLESGPPVGRPFNMTLLRHDNGVALTCLVQ